LTFINYIFSKKVYFLDSIRKKKISPLLAYLEKYFWLLPEKATSGHLEKIIPTSMKAL